MKVDVPMLSIVPIPNLQVDEVNILFDMEVKQSEKQESSMDMGATVTGSLRIGPIRVSVSDSVSAHQSNTRSSDNSAKYHVDVRATNHGIPEGLARVMDMMAVNISPSLVNSSLTDGNGQTLSEKSKIKAERLKALRHEIGQIEDRLNAANGNFNNTIGQLKRLATNQQNVYQGKIMQMMSELETDDPKNDVYSELSADINQTWSNLQNQAVDFVKILADSGSAEDGKVSSLFALKALSGEQAVEYADGESLYKALAGVQKSALDAQRNVQQIETELFNKKTEYSDVNAGKVTAALPQNS